MRKINRDIACALIESSDEKILMGRKDPKGGGVFTECWQIPGGGIEERESLEAAVVREVLEEVGLDIKAAKIELIDSEGTGQAKKRLESGEKVLCQMKFFVFQILLSAKANEIKITPGSDFIETRWFDKKALPVKELVPAGVVLFKKLKYIG